ncbi:MAG TPA: hypothetical protein VKJ00_07935, partial [Thermoanaerobaculia bacterium]|nr:hypothetical protein [Thermoanaerobaculia bacterium]
SLATYRFDPASEIAIPCGFLTKKFPASSVWPPNQPPSGDPRFGNKLIWNDTNGDGAVQLSEYENDGSPQYERWAWYPDSNGDVWAASQSNPAEIDRYLLQGIDAHGCLVYHSSAKQTYSIPAPFTEVLRAVYVPGASPKMYLAGFTTGQPNCVGGLCDDGTKNLGRAIAYYDTWPPSGNPVWTISDLPYSSANGFVHAARSMDIAGGRVFVGIEDTQEIREYDAATGVFLKKFRPGPEVGGKSGWIISPGGIGAFQRSNGEYLLSVEELFMSKELLYRDPLYHNTFNVGTNPFPASAPSGGGTSTLVTIAERPDPTTDPVDVNNKAVEFRDVTGTGGNNNSTPSLFTLTLSSTTPLVARLNQVYHLAVGSPSVSFDFAFKLERRLTSNRPNLAAIQAGIKLTYSDASTSFPTGSPDPVISGVAAYTTAHDEASGSEILESVDTNDVMTYRFTIAPAGPAAKSITSLDFRFQVGVNKTPGGQSATTPEAYAIDDLIVNEIAP